MNELFAFLFACVLIGIWALEMFCDSPYLEFSRAIRPTKNTTALTIPTFGSLMLVIAAAKTLERCWGKLPNAASSFVLTYCAIGIFVFIVSLFPINLPRVMYPEYQAEKRRLKRLRREYERDPLFVRRGPSLSQSRDDGCPQAPCEEENTWRG